MRKSVRDRIIERDGLTCAYCGILTHRKPDNSGDGAVVEHAIGRRFSEDSWLVVSCRKCNSEKNDLSVVEWLDKIDASIKKAESAKKIRTHVESVVKKMGGRTFINSEIAARSPRPYHELIKEVSL